MKRYVYVIALLVAIAAVLSTSAMAVPAPPIATCPSASGLVESNVPDIQWTGGSWDSYEIHIGTTNDPNNPNGWDSGQVYTSGSGSGIATSGYLGVQTTYYVFVRLHDSSGWSSWSAYGNSFYVNAQFLNEPCFIAGSGLEWYDAACYNPDRNEYLIAWNNGYVIHYRRLDSTGAPIGAVQIRA